MAFREEASPALPSETILRDILESVTDAVVTIDEGHKVLMCNRAAEVLFGYTSSEMIGRDVSPLIPNPHQKIHRSYVERYLDTGIPRVIGTSRECSIQRKDGSNVPVEISYSVSRTEGRLYFTAVIRDITERRDMEREIRFMERLADIGKAVAHIGHEIRKPLMLIGGFARQVGSSLGQASEEKTRQKLDIIVDEVRRLEALLNGLRLLTRQPGASLKEPLALNRVLTETFDLLQPMLQDRRIELEIELAQDPLAVRGDSDQLKQVFLNLLQNSVDAMNGEGKVRVVSQALAGSARIVFEDQGPGIPEGLKEKIFDPFFTTKSDGTGLGLAISRNIIQDHGGSLALVSSPPRGAVFIVELPLDTMR